MEALNEANRIRTKRAQLKKDLRAGRSNVNVLLLSPPDYILSAKVSDLLLAVPGLDLAEAERWLGDLLGDSDPRLGRLHAVVAEIRGA